MTPRVGEERRLPGRLVDRVVVRELQLVKSPIPRVLVVANVVS